MNKLDILKGGTELLVSIGVTSIVANVIKMTADPDAGRIKKIATGIGGFVLSNMVGDLATKYTNDKIDNAAVRINRILHPEEPIEIDITENVHVIIEATEQDTVEWDIDRNQPMSKTIEEENDQ